MSRDIYGFEVDKDYADLHKAMLPVWERQERQRCDEWDNLLRIADLNGHLEDVTDPSTQEALLENVLLKAMHSAELTREVHRLVHHGLPQQMRGFAWKLFLNVGGRRVAGYYENLVDYSLREFKAKGTSSVGELSSWLQTFNYAYSDVDLPEVDEKPVLSPTGMGEALVSSAHIPKSKLERWGPHGKDWLTQIEKDLHRTFPGHEVMSKDGQGPLRRVLAAYALHDPAIGYCQGMNFITGLLLLFMEEEDAFYSLCSIVEEILPGYYSKAMLAPQVDQRVFKQLVGSQFRELSTYLEDLGVDVSCLFAQWFLCCFVNYLPLETCLRVWDIMFWERSCVALFKVALALVEIYGAALMSTKDVLDACELLQCMAPMTYDANGLLQVACGNMYRHVTLDYIEMLRTEHRREVLAELESASRHPSRTNLVDTCLDMEHGSPAGEVSLKVNGTGEFPQSSRPHSRSELCEGNGLTEQEGQVPGATSCTSGDGCRPDSLPADVDHLFNQLMNGHHKRRPPHASRSSVNLRVTPAQPKAMERNLSMTAMRFKPMVYPEKILGGQTDNAGVPGEVPPSNPLLLSQNGFTDARAQAVTALRHKLGVSEVVNQWKDVQEWYQRRPSSSFGKVDGALADHLQDLRRRTLVKSRQGSRGRSTSDPGVQPPLSPRPSFRPSSSIRIRASFFENGQAEQSPKPGSDALESAEVAEVTGEAWDSSATSSSEAALKQTEGDVLESSSHGGPEAGGGAPSTETPGREEAVPGKAERELSRGQVKQEVVARSGPRKSDWGQSELDEVWDAIDLLEHELTDAVRGRQQAEEAVQQYTNVVELLHGKVEDLLGMVAERDHMIAALTSKQNKQVQELAEQDELLAEKDGMIMELQQRLGFNGNQYPRGDPLSRGSSRSDLRGSEGVAHLYDVQENGSPSPPADRRWNKLLRVMKFD